MKKSQVWTLSLIIISCLCCLYIYFDNNTISVFEKTKIIKDYISMEMGKTRFPHLKRSFNFTFKTIKEVWADLYSELPNFPTSFGEEKVFALDDCSSHPTIWDMNFNNMFWQRYLTSNGTFYLYSAHLDIRAANNHGPAIRVIGMLDRLDPSMKTFCYIWTNETAPSFIVEALDYTFLWRPEWTMNNPVLFQPYMITCLLPDSIKETVPISVSLVEERCSKPTNNLKVKFNVPPPGQQKTPFAVCVKGLSFPTIDFSVRLLEWLELLNILGAEKVFLYSLGVHPNVQKVMDYYTKTGFTKLTIHTLPGFLPIQPILQYIYLQVTVSMQMLIEIVQYHDCIYSNMYLYEYIALIDVDELLIPLAHDNWAQLVNMIKESTNKTWSSIEFRNLFFMGEMFDYHKAKNPVEVDKLLEVVPSYLHIMNNVYRNKNFEPYGYGIKCLHNAEQILIIHNHYPVKCLGPNACEIYYVNETTLGRMQHYRKDCSRVYGDECENVKQGSVLDTVIWKYKDRVVESSLKVMKEIGFFEL